jgi:hypothetical protein
MHRELFALARPLHLEEADLGPEQVEKPTRLMLLERGDGLSVRPVTGKQLVQERLRLTPLRAGVHRPAGGERRQALSDLAVGKRHRRALDRELLLAVLRLRRSRVVGALHQKRVRLEHIGGRLLERSDQVIVRAIPAQLLGRAIDSLLRIGDVEKRSLDLHEVIFVHC